MLSNSCSLGRDNADILEKSVALILSEALESSVQLWKYPKTSIDVSILIIEDDGGSSDHILESPFFMCLLSGVIPAAITCASLAIADAGIEMYDLVSSTSLAFQGTSILLDPSFHDIAGSSGHLLVSYMSNRSEITHLSLSSKDLSSQQFSEVLQNCCQFIWSLLLKQYIQALELCIDGCEKIYRLMRECLTTSFNEKQSWSSKWLWIILILLIGIFFEILFYWQLIMLSSNLNSKKIEIKFHQMKIRHLMSDKFDRLRQSSRKWCIKHIFSLKTPLFPQGSGYSSVCFSPQDAVSS